MRTPLTDTVLATKDINDQPKADYVLLCSDGKKGYLVDSVSAVGDIMQAWQGGRIVFSAPLQSSWNLIHKDYLDMMTEEDMARKLSSVVVAAKKLHEELHVDADEKDSGESVIYDPRSKLYL